MSREPAQRNDEQFSTAELAELYSHVIDVLPGAEEIFRRGVGADPAKMKGKGDFCTEVDMEIETYLRDRLYEKTGIPVVGEEFGGEESATMWVVDPIDGTANFAAGNPMSAILISLIHQGNPLIGVTSIPLSNQRFGAYEGSPLFVNDQPVNRQSGTSDLVSHVGFSSLSSPRDTKASRFPTALRSDLLLRLSSTYLRPRITGSVGIDLAFSAAGIFDGALNLSPNAWDNAAGVVLVRAAGGIVTDVDGQEWHLGAVGAIAGSKHAHSVISAELKAAQAVFDVEGK